MGLCRLVVVPIPTRTSSRWLMHGEPEPPAGAARRLQFANDRVVLLAVDGPQNESKGDDDASEWLPPRTTYDCRYVAKQITIKTKYTLVADQTRTQRDGRLSWLLGLVADVPSQSGAADMSVGHLVSLRR